MTARQLGKNQDNSVKKPPSRVIKKAPTLGAATGSGNLERINRVHYWILRTAQVQWMRYRWHVNLWSPVRCDQSLPNFVMYPLTVKITPVINITDFIWLYVPSFAMAYLSDLLLLLIIIKFEFRKICMLILRKHTPLKRPEYVFFFLSHFRH